MVIPFMEVNNWYECKTGLGGSVLGGRGVSSVKLVLGGSPCFSPSGPFGAERRFNGQERR